MSKTTLSRTLLSAIVTTCATCALAAGPSSTNYQIAWDVVDGGGGNAMSASYTLNDSVAQPSALGTSSSASYILQAGFLTPPDFDADGVRNFMDNCTQDANADQSDANSDGYGNVCDPDINNDGIVNAADLGILKSRFFTGDAEADLNGDGVVNAGDLGIMKQRFFTAPGPSGLAP